MGEVKELHVGCMACSAKLGGDEPDVAVLSVLAAMVRCEADVGQARRELCFFHRRLLDDTLGHWPDEPLPTG